jgi:N-acetylneuraminic acid mutarotase
VIGSKIFLVAAADFYAPPGTKDQDFSVVGRGSDPVGRALLELDTANLHAGWKRLADLPGTPRFDTCAAAVAGKIYVLSGVHRDTREKSAGYANVVDSWCYDPSLARWFPLPDMPHISNQRAVAWRDRNLILVGNYRYRFTRRPDGRIEDVYTPEERTMDWKQFFGAKVMVFDAKTNRLFETDPLLDRTSLPMAAIAGDTVYTLGGEGGTRLWHPATFQIGRIRQAQ